VTLVIPAYNEEARLPKTLMAVATFLDEWGIDYRVIVVDDGSQDKTARIAEQSGYRFSTLTQPNSGKGAAVRRGFLAATGRIVAFTDADLPFDLASLRLAYEAIDSQRSDAVFGSRTLSQSANKAKRQLIRIVASHVFQLFVQLVAAPTVRDTQCGLKVFSRLAAQEIFSRATIDGFAFDVEVIFLAQQLTLRIHELPVVLVNEHGSTISLSRSAVPMLFDLARLRWRKMKGAYKLTGRKTRDISKESPPLATFGTPDHETIVVTVAQQSASMSSKELLSREKEDDSHLQSTKR
jgi:dolichyl-phosphate beta-glucosyltransferase